MQIFDPAHEQWALGYWSLKYDHWFPLLWLYSVSAGFLSFLHVGWVALVSYWGIVVLPKNLIKHIIYIKDLWATMLTIHSNETYTCFFLAVRKLILNSLKQMCHATLLWRHQCMNNMKLTTELKNCEETMEILPNCWSRSSSL